MSSVIQSNVVEENDVDDFDSPNVYPYKKCSCCEERSSCGNYNEDKEWVCENCGEDAEIHQCGVCEETQVKGYSTCCEDCGLMTCKDCLKIYSGICCRCADESLICSARCIRTATTTMKNNYCEDCPVCDECKEQMSK